MLYNKVLVYNKRNKYVQLKMLELDGLDIHYSYNQYPEDVFLAYMNIARKAKRYKGYKIAYENYKRALAIKPNSKKADRKMWRALKEMF